MGKYAQYFQYIGVAAIVLLLVGLGGWYLFLRSAQTGIEASDAARGFNIAVPSFTGSRGSTSENIGAGLSGGSLLLAQSTGGPPRLWRISTSPVAGAAFIPDTRTIRYVERSTGYIYDANPQTGSVTRQTNTLIPKVYNATVLTDGVVILEVLDESGAKMALLGTVSTSTENGYYSLHTEPLGSDVVALSPSPSRAEALLVGQSGTAGALVQLASSGTATPITPLPLIHMVPLSTHDGRMFVAERPGSSLEGYAYEVAEGKLHPLVRAIQGLIALPRASSTALLYSSDDGVLSRLFVRPSANASTTQLSLPTVASKCVWRTDAPSTSDTPTLAAYCAAPQDAPPARFIDRWLRGQAHTTDSWFLIDAAAGSAERFFAPDATTALDVERPIIDNTGEYIVFMNARDKSLWMLRVNE